MSTKASAAKAKMVQITEARSTEQLFADLAMLDTYRVTSPATGMHYFPKEEHRIAAAHISDAIEAREGLEAAMEEIFMDDDFAGTYLEALTQAYVTK